jgi:hypothetical protein
MMTNVGEQARFVATAAIREAVGGRETDVLDALGIDWRAGRPHITCPYSDHGGARDWRWDAKAARARCTCTKGDSIFDILMRVEGIDFDAAKVRAAELIGRSDLIRNGGGQSYQATDAASLMTAPADRRDDNLPISYLASRLGVAADAVPIPRTPMIGLKRVGYYDPPPSGSKAKPRLVGEFPCAVFGTIAADGRTHAHRIYLAPGGAGKADLGYAPDGRPRDPKKSARIIGDDNTAGRSVLWGDAGHASHVIVAEGVETAAAVALALAAEIEAGEMAVAAAISANGVEAFQPYPATLRVTVAADRDEAPKLNGKPGSGRGEQAARAFALRHREALDIAIALPGKPGEAVDWLDLLRRDGADAVRRGILAATPFARTPAELNAAEKADIEARRPMIRVMGGDLADATAAALAVLASEPDPMVAVYLRGTLLVRPMRLHDRLSVGGLRRPMDALCVRIADVDWLCLRLSQVADWYVIRDKNVKPVDPPQRICRSVLAAAPWDGLPVLTGVIEAPTIRPDGSLLTTPGYDPATSLLFDPGDTRFPRVPETPTRADAEVALEMLKQPFVAFPFVSEADRSVALSSVLTALVCRLLRAVPLFGYSAPKMASGKTLLATIASYIACGRTPYLMSQAQDPTDERKRLLSALIEGPAMLVIDNVERPLQSDALCTAITEPTYTDRLLGQSRTVTVESNCLYAATGNNLTLAGDLTARAILCRLDPEVERPEQREFGVNLHEWVPAHRGELVAAALTIVRAYIFAGEPRQALANFARFEGWQRLCRFPLTWLGLADPCQTRESIEAADPVRENLRMLLGAWHDHFGDRPATVAQAITAATNARNRAGDTLSFSGDGLNEAMMSIAGEKGAVNSRRLGRFIARHERRIEGALRFIRAGTSDKTALWRVAKEGFQGFQGLSPSPSREKENGNAHGCEEGILGERLERNPSNPLNPAALMFREVDL